MADIGKKNDQGKLRLELVPVEAIEAIARAMTYGANKYGDWNWSLGIAHTRLFGAALRHMWAYFRGEDIDVESGNHHLDHALASLAMLRASVANELGKDDRPGYMHKEQQTGPSAPTTEKRAATKDELKQYMRERLRDNPETTTITTYTKTPEAAYVYMKGKKVIYE